MPAPALPLLDSLLGPGRADAVPHAVRCSSEQELTVSELCAVLQLPQSTVSRHLKTLADAGLGDVAARRHEPLLRARARRRRRPHAQIWRADAAAARRARPALEQDARRLAARARAAQRDVAAVLRLGGGAVGSTCAKSCSAATSRWQALVGLLPSRLGRRRSRLRHRRAAAGARAARRARDRRRRVGRDAGRRARAHGGRSPTSSCGAARSKRCRSTTRRSTPRRWCSCCTTCRRRPPRSPKPRASSSPAAACCIVDMAPHEREEYRQQMGHVWLGFSEDRCPRWLTQAGFTQVTVRALPPADEAKGPALFAATAQAASGRVTACQITHRSHIRVRSSHLA